MDLLKIEIFYLIQENDFSLLNNMKLDICFIL